MITKSASTGPARTFHTYCLRCFRAGVVQGKYEICGLARVAFFALLVACFASPGGRAQTAPANPTADATAPGADATTSLNQLFDDPILARGLGIEIRRGELEMAVTQHRASMAAERADIPENQITTLEALILDRLLLIRMLTARATTEDRAKAVEAATRIVEDFKKNARSEEAFQRDLKSRRLTSEKFSSMVTDQALMEAVLERELKPTVTVSDEQVQKYFDGNPQQFRQPELARGTHIVAALKNPETSDDLSETEKKKKREKIEKLLRRARAGEDFEKLAHEASEDPLIREKKGEFTIPRGSRFPELEGAAFSLKPGQISEVVTTPFGYHIIKLKELVPGKQIEFKEVSQQIRDALLQREVQLAIPAYFDGLKKEAQVEILDARLKAASAAAAEAASRRVAEASSASTSSPSPAATPAAPDPPKKP